MVGLAFSVAACANFPVLVLSMFWKGLTTRGAVIGEIVDDEASKGAQVGAATGVMRARSASRQANQQAADAQNSANQQAYAQNQGNFKKAMSICLEARGYSVK